MLPQEFASSRSLTLGIELELQLLDWASYDLAPRSAQIMEALKGRKFPGDIKLEITQSMIEMSTGICDTPAQALEELSELRLALLGAADDLGVKVSGGGTHPFQKWMQQRVVDDQRGRFLSDTYGYLCQQLTVFGQHVHVGVPGADEALCLLHALSRYIPHFIALSASSPFVQGVDTGYDSARLNSLASFPFAGRAPLLLSWKDFEDFFARMARTGVVRSMKDFYWDIRPKPEFGTVEVRVMDTPLTLAKATALAAYVQALARWLLVEKPCRIEEDDYLLYEFNRFQACRFGLDGVMVDSRTGEHVSLREDILETFRQIENHVMELGTEAECRLLMDEVRSGNDASWIREVFAQEHSMPALMKRQAERWQ